MASLLRGYISVVVGVVVLIATGCGGGGIGRCEAAEGLDHVVGGDQGWDAASDVAAWSIDRVFRVGDNIYDALRAEPKEHQSRPKTSDRIRSGLLSNFNGFAYSATRESIIELASKEEFESCELDKPIRMYTSGLDRVSLDGAGARYFSSGKLESCQNGLKLHAEVVPQVEAGEQADQVKQVMKAKELAAGPQPSGSSHITQSALMVIGFVLLCFMAL